MVKDFDVTKAGGKLPRTLGAEHGSWEKGPEEQKNPATNNKEISFARMEPMWAKVSNPHK